MTDQTNQQPPEWVTDPSKADPERLWNTLQNQQAKIDEYSAREQAANTRIAELSPEGQQAKDDRIAELGVKEAEHVAEIQRLNIVLDAQRRHLPYPKDIPDFIDKELWAIDSNAAFRQLSQDKPYLFRYHWGGRIGVS